MVKAVKHEAGEDTSFEITCKIYDYQGCDQSAEFYSCRWTFWYCFAEVDRRAENGQNVSFARRLHPVSRCSSYHCGHMCSLYCSPEYWQNWATAEPPTVDYEAMQKDSGLGNLLHSIVRLTIRRMSTESDRPGNRENMDSVSSTTCQQRQTPPILSLSKLVPSGILTTVSTPFGGFRRTIINNALTGGFYDFTSDLSSKDTAYTSESLEPHTDTTYFTDPIVSTPRLYYLETRVIKTNNVLSGVTSTSFALPHRRRRRPIISRGRLWRRQTSPRH